MGPLRPRECYILSDCTEKQSIIRTAQRQRRKRERGASKIDEMQEEEKERT